MINKCEFCNIPWRTIRACLLFFQKLPTTAHPKAICLAKRSKPVSPKIGHKHFNRNVFKIFFGDKFKQNGTKTGQIEIHQKI